MSIKYSVCVCVCVCILALVIRHISHFFFCAVLYCHLWPFSLYHISRHCLTNGQTSREKILNTKHEF
jgi:hypothetical protein